MDVMTRVPVREQDPQVRAANFEEVCLGYNAEEAMAEATRCLNCKNAQCMKGCPVSINIPAFIAQDVYKRQENEELQSEQQKAIERTEEVFRQIIAQIEQLNAGMENINRLNADMSSNKDTVVSRMEAIASVSEQSAAATEEVNASTDQVNTTMADITDYTKTLQNIAQDLEQTIEKFRLMEI